MSKHSRSATTIALIAAASAIVIGDGQPVSAAPPPEVGVTVSLVTDGTAPFDPVAGPGFDTGAADGVVRTLDLVRYSVDYQFNHVSSVARTVTLVATGGGFAQIPGACAASSSISADASTLTCEIAATPTSGVVGSFDIDVLVGAVADGSTISLDATATAGGATAIYAADDVAATAVPRWDLEARHMGDPRTTDVFGDGNDGFLISVPIVIEADLSINDGRGSEGLALADLHFTVDISALDQLGNPQAQQPAWRLLDFTNPMLGDLASCGPLRADSGARPYGTIGAPGTAENSVTDSGSWTCTQPAPGEPIDVVVSAAALNTAHFPSTSGFGAPLTPRKIVVSGEAIVFVDLAYIESILPPPNGGEFPIEWTVTGFDPTGASGGSNYGAATEPLFNNTDRVNVTHYYSGGWDSLYMNSYQEMNVDHPTYGPGIYFDARPQFMDPSHSVFVPSQTQQDHAGDGVITPGDRFAFVMERSGASGTGYNTAMCAMIDPTLSVLVDNPPIIRRTVDTTPGPTYGATIGTTTVLAPPGPVISTSSSVGGGSGDPTAPDDGSIPHVIEYGTGDWSPSNSTCDDADSPTGWTTDPATTPGAGGGVYPAVTKIRVRTLSPLGATSHIRAFVSLQAATGVPVGNYIWSHATYGDWDPITVWDGSLDSWNPSAYDPVAHDNVHFGDRLTAADRTLAVVKTAVGYDRRRLVPGDTVDFSLTATITGAAADFVRLVDTLPAGVSLVSADPAATSLVGDVVTWEWGATPGGTTRQVTYTVRIDADAATGATLVNTVVGDANGLAQSGNTLTSYAAIYTTSPYRQLDVWKSTPDDVVEISDDVQFTLHAANTSNVELAQVDLIDVLPWNGDSRDPASGFAGDWVLAPVSVDPGLTLRVTAAAPASIDDDPAAVSNQPAGATVWCAAADLGSVGCPSGWADVTAIRVGVPTLEPGAEIAIGITLQPVGNAEADLYANVWAGRYDGATYIARSDEVAVGVVASTLTITVTCADTGAPVAGVNVSIESLGLDTVTGLDGRVNVATPLHSGNYTVEYDATALVDWTITGATSETINVGVDDDVSVNASLSACPPAATATTSTTTSTMAAQPPTTAATTTSTTVERRLPITGSNGSQQTVLIAIAAMIGGLATLASTRRRRR